MRITQATFSDLANSRNTTIIKRWLVQFWSTGPFQLWYWLWRLLPLIAESGKDTTSPNLQTGNGNTIPALAKDGMTLHRKTTSAIVASARLYQCSAATISTAGRHFNPSTT